MVVILNNSSFQLDTCPISGMLAQKTPKTPMHAWLLLTVMKKKPYL